MATAIIESKTFWFLQGMLYGGALMALISNVFR